MVFVSAAALTPDDGNGLGDVFLRDLGSNPAQTVRVSVAAVGPDPNGFSASPDISSSGRFVAFSSAATNLVLNDDNAASDIFVYDRQTGRTTRMSVSSMGDQGNASSSGPPSLSSDGRSVAFLSTACNLVFQDSNGHQDVFVRDRGSALGE